MATKYAKARAVAGQWRSEFRKVRRENRSLRAVYVEAKALLEAVGVAAHIAATKRLREAMDAAVFAAPAKAGPVMCGSAMVLCERFDREPCPHQPERRCDSCPGGNAKRATPPQPGEGGA